MSDTHNLSPLPSAVHIGQNTSIEHTRAATEVQALVFVAQNRPRIKALCIQQMEEVCSQETFAGTAFYDYKRGGKRIYDINVDTAKELARCWGNIQYGITELSQDRDRHESEMMAWAWDMQGNLRAERKVVIPHVRDSNDKGPQILTDVRDVYELLANHASRRVRECIKDVLPGWFITDAKKAMWRTLEYGGGEPLSKRVAGVVKVFANEYGVRLSQLEAKVEAKSNDWTEMDVARLKVSYGQLGLGVRVEDEFPPIRVDSNDLANTTLATPPSITATKQTITVPVPDAVQEDIDNDPQVQADRAAVAAHAAALRQEADHLPAEPEPGPDKKIGHGFIQLIHQQLNQFDYPDTPEGKTLKIRDLSVLVGRKLTSAADLTVSEYHKARKQLNACLADDNPDNALDAVLDALRTETEQP